MTRGPVISYRFGARFLRIVVILYNVPAELSFGDYLAGPRIVPAASLVVNAEK